MTSEGALAMNGINVTTKVLLKRESLVVTAVGNVTPEWAVVALVVFIQVTAAWKHFGAGCTGQLAILLASASRKFLGWSLSERA